MRRVFLNFTLPLTKNVGAKESAEPSLIGGDVVRYPHRYIANEGGKNEDHCN